MKISYRLLFINFVIVLLILSLSGIAFYSIFNNVITSQQSKHLVSATNSFAYQLESAFQDVDQEFFLLYQKAKPYGFDKKLFEGSKLDFVFVLQKDSLIDANSSYFSGLVSIPGEKISYAEFQNSNPFTIIKRYNLKSGSLLCYGRIINNDFLNAFYTRINNDIAVVLNNKTVITSNESINQNLALFLTEASKELSIKKSFDIFSQSSESADLYAAIYRPKTNYIPTNINFIIFSKLNEAAELRSSLKLVMIILCFAGLSLSLILSLLFTGSLRKQINKLSEATEITKTGNFHVRITVNSGNELGMLASAFNKMLDELEKKEKINNEYAEFIALINQNPTFHQVAENALTKIIKTGGFNTGAIYNIDNNNIALASSYGIKDESDFSKEKTELFKPVLKTRDTFNLSYENNPSQFTAELLEMGIKNLLIIPILYNNKIIALLELGSAQQPGNGAMEYISKIKEQLAIGLTNARALVQLENLVTELKNLNEEYQKQNLQVKAQNDTLRKLHKNLEEKAAELEDQKEKAEGLTQVKSQFLASMSHELRTPLNSIMGLTELIVEDKSITGKNRERLNVVLRNGQRLMQLINDILDLSKVESGKMEIIEESLQLEELLKEIYDSVHLLAINKNLSFTIERDCDTSFFITTDKTKVIQVLFNLISNAIKFTDKGGVKLAVSEKEGFIVFKTIDTGIGISKENQKIIFEEFRQVDGTLTRKYSGTGLGLAICKRIALLMKGDITVESKIGIGSVFSFSIPAQKILQPEVIKTAIPADKAKQNYVNLVVVIDNNIDTQTSFEHYFRSKGFEVEFASTGKAGFEKAKILQPVLVSLNVLLPDENAFETLSMLKTAPETKQIPISLVAVNPEKNTGYGFNIFGICGHDSDSVIYENIINKIEKTYKTKIASGIVITEKDSSFKKIEKLLTGKNITLHKLPPDKLTNNFTDRIKPGFILSDISGKKENAFSVLAQIKNNTDLKNVPFVIYYSAPLSVEEDEKLLQTCVQITDHANSHPLDALRAVREQIRIFEATNLPVQENETGSINAPDVLANEDSSEYMGVVLIADDDPDTLFTISEIVEECRCKTLRASNGIECLQLLESVTPDLILLDIMMPGMDGFQTINKIKENKKWARIPVYAVTAKAMIEDKQVILNHGFDDYISKPVSSNILAFKIQKIINKTDLL